MRSLGRKSKVESPLFYETFIPSTPPDTIARPIMCVRFVLSASLRRDLDQAMEELKAELTQRQRFSPRLR
jgi:hypothetical protein